MAVLFQVLCHMLRDENMTGITAIHDPLCNVDSCPRYVCAATYVHYAADRSAMDPHAELEFRVFARSVTDLQRALHRRLRSVVENKRHAVTSRHGNEPTLCLRRAKVFRLADNFV